MPPFLPHPDPMPVREALRVLRHGLRRGRQVFRDTVPVEALPAPAAQIAETVLQGLDSIAVEVDQATTHVARWLLTEGAPRIPAFQDLGTGPEAEQVFARAMYVALRGVLRHLGDSDAFISEALLRRACLGFLAREPGRGDGDPVKAAADMAFRLVEARVIRDIVPGLEARLPAGGAAPVVVFAALLWLMSDRSEADAHEALTSAADLSLALGGDITAAMARDDRLALAALFAQFAPHV